MCLYKQVYDYIFIIITDSEPSSVGVYSHLWRMSGSEHSRGECLQAFYCIFILHLLILNSVLKGHHHKKCIKHFMALNDLIGLFDWLK